MKDTLISIGGAAKRLGVSIQTLRAWDKSGYFKAVKTSGGHRKYRDLEIESFIRGNKVEYEKVTTFECNLTKTIHEAKRKEAYEQYKKTPWAEYFKDVQAWPQEDIALLLKNQYYADGCLNGCSDEKFGVFGTG